MELTLAVAALAALAQETRLAIFRLLVRHAPAGLPAGEIAEKLELAPATLSFHLKELAQARLVIAVREGRFVWYRPGFAAMNALVGYLTEHCCEAACGPSCAPADAAKAVAIPGPRKRKRRVS